MGIGGERKCCRRCRWARWSLDAYDGLAPEPILQELREHARALRGARILHVNATAYGGGVSELLRSSVPLLRDLGLTVDWQVIGGSQESSSSATKALHNGLQGAPRGAERGRAGGLPATASSANAAELDGGLRLRRHPRSPARRAAAAFTARATRAGCGAVTSTPPSPTPTRGASCARSSREFDAAVFTMPEFVPPDLPIARVADDRAGDRSAEPEEHRARPSARPARSSTGSASSVPGRLVTQVSRFDPWKDPLGVIAAYRLVREEIAGPAAGAGRLDGARRPRGLGASTAQSPSAPTSDPLIHIYTNLTGVGNVEVNAFQRLSDVVVQKSIREGFGLVVSESLWKGTPVVAGRAGGIPMQMPEGVGGLLVDSVEECARRCSSCSATASCSSRLGHARARARARALPAAAPADGGAAAAGHAGRR